MDIYFIVFYVVFHVGQSVGYNARVFDHDAKYGRCSTQEDSAQVDGDSLLTLVSFTVFGRFLFMVFGLSTNGFRLAGGIVIFKIGWDMLQAKFTRMKLADTEIKEYADDISITPLAIPMLCGPGGIANGIVLMEDARTPLYVAGLVTVIAVVFLITYLILKASTRLVEIIGETGNNVMMRLMGLILMVIAVECFVSGLRPIVKSMIDC